MAASTFAKAALVKRGLLPSLSPRTNLSLRNLQTRETLNTSFVRVSLVVLFPCLLFSVFLWYKACGSRSFLFAANPPLFVPALQFLLAVLNGARRTAWTTYDI